MIILDGKGRGTSAGVSDENRLYVNAISASAEHHTNHHDGEAYNLLFSQSPTAADDAILYIENKNDIDLILEGIELSVDAACTVYMKIGDSGTPNNPTAITPVNLNSGSGKNADGTFYQGADLDNAGASLTGGTKTNHWIFRAATDTHCYNLSQDIILKKSGTITLWCDSSAATVTGWVSMNYHNVEG